MNDMSDRGYAGIDDVNISAEMRSLDELPPDLVPVQGYWTRLKPAGAVGPTWRSFDLMEIPAAYLPAALVADYLGTGQGYRFRYWGSALTPVFGKDMTGKTFDECPKSFRETIHVTYDMVRERRAPCLIRVNANAAGNATHFHTAFRLPLSSDGTTVDQIVSILLVTHRKDEWAKFWD